MFIKVFFSKYTFLAQWHLEVWFCSFGNDLNFENLAIIEEVMDILVKHDYQSSSTPDKTEH